MVGLPRAERGAQNAQLVGELPLNQPRIEALAVDVLAKGRGFLGEGGADTLVTALLVASRVSYLALAITQQLQRIVLTHAPRQPVKGLRLKNKAGAFSCFNS